MSTTNNVPDMEKPPTISTSATKLKNKKMCGAAKKRYKYFLSIGMDQKTARKKCLFPLPKRKKFDKLVNISEAQENKRSGNSDTFQTKKNVLGSVKRKMMEVEKEPREKNMCGAAKRRLKNLLSSGMNEETAREKCLIPFPRKEIEGEINIGIIPRNFPNKKMKIEEIMLLQKEILKLLSEQKNESIQLRFTRRPTAKFGWMIFHCTDKLTANWLQSQELWTDKELITVDKNKFPEGHILVGYFKKSFQEKSIFILGIVEAQNKDLDPSTWKIVKRENDKKGGATITVEVDGSTFKTLEKTEFLVHYAFGQRVRLKPETKLNEKQPEPKSSSNRTLNHGLKRRNDIRSSRFSPIRDSNRNSKKDRRADIQVQSQRKSLSRENGPNESDENRRYTSKYFVHEY